MKFVIMSPPYDEQNGGSIVLHKLCDLISRAGHEASIFPLFQNGEINPLDWPGSIQSCIVERLGLENTFGNRETFRLCERYQTKLFDADVYQIPKDDDFVVVYPEIVFGNPLGAKNVARWILHNPGFHTGKVYYTIGEVQFAFNDLFKPLAVPYMEVAPFHLSIFDIPWGLYHDDGSNSSRERRGTAYLVKKGHGRAAVHDLENSVCIDGLGHEEVAAIFKSVEMFISYDQASFYSHLAALAGCASVIVPDTASSTRPGDAAAYGRNGIAYGFEDIQRAIDTVPQMIVELQEQERESVRSVDRFLQFWSSRLSRST